ncbi:heavy metal-associated isoprenylated plant protein 26 [Panicum miliaceum]|uniref:Heavy metal-associated isoprenylated plant protein 26 n=1 Tax=Panicum miliaceum TaxID=4540 RepID=A0A3L6RS32_PANMI|nr:heavy metal-associated isoprenylated plant protein 26 [Panicum miliaceum]
MNVHMDCDGCEKRVRKAMSRLQGTHWPSRPSITILLRSKGMLVSVVMVTGRAGVSSVEIDMDRQKVTVTGHVDRREVLRAARRTGRAAEFWPWPYDAEYYPFAIQYLADDTYVATDRYHRHGYNDPMIGSYPCHAFTHVVGDDALAVFHEDNVHACAVMQWLVVGSKGICAEDDTESETGSMIGADRLDHPTAHGNMFQTRGRFSGCPDIIYKQRREIHPTITVLVRCQLSSPAAVQIAREKRASHDCVGLD